MGDQAPAGIKKTNMDNDETVDQELVVQRLIGAKIRELRLARQMRAVDLAGQAGLSQSQLSKIETGKATLSIKALGRLCRILERPLSYLFQSEEEIPRVLGTLATVAGPERKGFEWFADEVRRATGKKMSLIPLSASQLAPADDQVEQLRQGVIDVFVEQPVYFHRYAPELNVLASPYAFAHGDHLTAFLESDWFRDRIVVPLLNHGVRFLNHRWNWKRGVEWTLVSRKPIVTPEDVRGLRVRIMDVPVIRRFWEELGARPVVIPWADVKTALRLGQIDVLPTNKTHLYPMGLCRYGRYVTCLGDVSPTLAVAMNDLKYQALPPGIQQALLDACDRAGDYFSQAVVEAEKGNESRNMAEYEAAYLRVDVTPWREASAGIRGKLLESGELSRRCWAQVELLGSAA